jgi:hypothetical protein
MPVDRWFCSPIDDAMELSAETKRVLWEPEGFVVLSATAEFLHKTTDYWAPEFERSIAEHAPLSASNGPSKVNRSCPQNTSKPFPWQKRNTSHD